MTRVAARTIQAGRVERYTVDRIIQDHPIQGRFTKDPIIPGLMRHGQARQGLRIHDPVIPDLRLQDHLAHLIEVVAEAVAAEVVAVVAVVDADKKLNKIKTYEFKSMPGNRPFAINLAMESKYFRRTAL